MLAQDYDSWHVMGFAMLMMVKVRCQEGWTPNQDQDLRFVEMLECLFWLSLGALMVVVHDAIVSGACYPHNNESHITIHNPPCLPSIHIS